MEDNIKLIKQCQKKTTKAFDELYRLYSPLIYGICLRYTKNKEEAEDLMQECFIKILNKINDFQFKGSFEGWIKKLTVNYTINYIKSNKKSFFNDEILHDIPDEKYNCDVISEMTAKEIIELINSMPTGYRTVFNMYAVEGYKHAEIAEMLNISETTSKTQFMKAKAFLMKLILKDKHERF